MSNEQIEADVVLTVVHGTFARGAPWTDENSPFIKALIDELGVRVHIERQLWSGWNSLAARAKGADQLAATLRTLRRSERYKDARHFVIGHSHGGAVAYYATSQAPEVDGVICLSTPFINLCERPYSELLLNSLMWSLALLLPAVGGYLGYGVSANVGTDSLPRWVIGVGLATVGALLGWMCRAMFYVLLQAERKYINRLLWPRTAEHALIVRLAGDEASLVLGLANCVSWLWQVVVSPTFLPLVWLQRLRDTIRKRQPASRSWRELLLGALPGSTRVLLAWGQSLYMLMLAPLLIPIVAISIIPFGFGLAIHSLFIEINVDTTPFGAWRVCCLPQDRSTSMFGLRHSSYAHPEVVRILSEWIKTGEANVSRHASPKPRMIGV